MEFEKYIPQFMFLPNHANGSEEEWGWMFLLVYVYSLGGLILFWMLLQTFLHLYKFRKDAKKGAVCMYLGIAMSMIVVPGCVFGFVRGMRFTYPHTDGIYFLWWFYFAVVLISIALRKSSWSDTPKECFQHAKPVLYLAFADIVWMFLTIIITYLVYNGNYEKYSRGNLLYDLNVSIPGFLHNITNYRIQFSVLVINILLLIFLSVRNKRKE